MQQFTIAQTGQWKLAGNNLAGGEKLGSTNNSPLSFITNNKTRMLLTGAGNLNISSDQSSIQFALPGANPKPMMFMFPSGDFNTNRMVIAHSPAFSNYGLQYNDAAEKFDFLSAGSSVFNVNLNNRSVGVTGLFNVAGDSRFSGNVNIDQGFHLQVGNTDGAQITIGSFETLSDGGASKFHSNSDIDPDGDGFRSLGSSAERWFTVFAVNGVINTSDARDKTNIRDLSYGLKDIMKLRSVKFNWLNKSSEGDKLGLIAQDLQKVIPEVVRDFDYVTDEKTGLQTKIPAKRLGVMYSDLVPVLIKGMQEQQSIIEKQQASFEQQQEIIEKLQSDMDDLKKRMSTSFATTNQSSNVSKEISDLSLAHLNQNAPNPFNSATVINYYLPETEGNASIEVISSNGQLVKAYPVTQKGNGLLTIKAGELSAGTYYYTLMVNGAKVDSKQMVMVK